jgi:MFS family permease
MVRLTEPARRLILLSAKGFLVATAQAIVVPLAALYATRLGASPSLVGIVVALGFLVPLLAAIRVGRLTDRFGVRTVMALGVTLLLVGPLPVVVAPSVASLVVLIVLTNLGHVSIVVASQHDVARTLPSREAAYGWFTTSVSVGQLVGPMAMGIAVELGGFPAGLGVTAAASGLAVLLMVLWGRTMLSARQAPTDGYRKPSIGSALAGSRAVPLSIASSGAVLFTMGVHQVFYPIVLDTAGVGISTIGLVLSARAGAAIIVRPILPVVARTVRSNAALFAASLAACAVGIALPLFAAPVALGLVGSVLIGVGSGFAQPLSMVILVDNVSAAARGALLGVRMAVNYGGIGLSSFSVGAAVSALGGTAAFALAALPPAALAMSVLRYRSDVDGRIPADNGP